MATLSTNLYEKSEGQVKWFDSKKGYGFIINDAGGDDLFVHWSGIIEQEGYKSLNEGDLVAFDIVKGNNIKKKFQAVNVRVIQQNGERAVPTFKR